MQIFVSSYAILVLLGLIETEKKKRLLVTFFFLPLLEMLFHLTGTKAF